MAGRTSSFQFSGKGHDLSDIGRKLKVKTILEGSVRKAGTRLRVNAQFINADDGYHLWSERYDRDMEDVFAVQDEIARSVVEKLKVKLLGKTDTPLVTRQVDDVEVYNLCLKGRFYASKMTEDSLGRALECYADALVKEPRYARAHVGIGHVHALRGILSIESPRSATAKAEAAVRTALAIDDSLDATHYESGFNLFWYAWDWDGAERAFQRTLQLNSNHAAALDLSGYMLVCLDRVDEGIRLARRAVEIEPIAPAHSHMLASTLAVARRFDDAIVQKHRTLGLDSTFLGAFWVLGVATVALGKYQDAVKLIQPGIPSARENVLLMAHLAYAQALAGHREEAEQILDRLQERRRSRFTSPWCIAVIYTGLGQHDETMRWLETAYQERDPLLTVCNVWPAFDPLRSDPRFQALLRRMNFPQQA